MQSTLSPVFVIAFSGHRPKAGVEGRSPSELADCQPLIEDALTKFRQQAETVGGKIQLLTSVAAGADLAACHAAEVLGIPVHIILPLPEALFKEDFTSWPDQWAQAQEFIERGRTRMNGWSLRLAKSRHERAEDTHSPDVDCYADANFEMLSHADGLICVSLPGDGTPPSISGSLQMLEDAAKRRLPRINIDPVTKKDSHCDTLPFLTSSENPRVGLKIISKLNQNIPDLVGDGSHAALETAQSKVNDTAEKHATFMRSGLKYTILLHGTASLLAGAALAFALSTSASWESIYFWLFILASVELILIAAAEYLHRRMHHHGEAWIEYRTAAEALSALITSRAFFDPLRTLVDGHGPNWRRLVLSANAVFGPPEAKSLTEAKNEYLVNRINDQRDYFSGKAAKASPKSKWLYKGMRTSSMLALPVVMFAAYSKWHHWHLLSTHQEAHAEHPGFDFQAFFLYLLPVALPLISGVLLGLRQSLDLSRREHRYHLMAAQLKEAEHDLEAAHTTHAFQQVVTRVEQLLLMERIEFEVAQKIGFEH